MSTEARRDVLKGIEGFTPGPWETKPEEVDRDYIRVRGAALGHTYKIANVYVPVSTHPVYVAEARDNARLIARAPELVEEIRALRASVRAAYWEGWRHGMNAVTEMHPKWGPCTDSDPESGWERSSARALLPDTGSER